MSTKHHERREERDPAKNAGNGVEATFVPETPEAPPAAPSGAAESSRPPVAEPAAAELSALRERVGVLEAENARLAEECSSLKDQNLRRLADYENFRKRMFRERDDAAKYANAGILGDLVPILDDFDRAVASAEHAKDYVVLHDGVVLIRRQLGSTLENKYGLQRYACVGEPFDPNVHEAVAMEQGSVAEPVVAAEFLPGYKLHDRIVRTAKVRVRMPDPAAQAAADGQTNDATTGGAAAETAGPGPEATN
ncbi:MAG: nucleotide exchange factor GrpE [Spirochaetaceae bacterium]|nr:nucleotide exchange factor GrpE [Spirochaetaceae bacterium]